VPDDQGRLAADASSFRGKALIGVAGLLLFAAVASAVPWGHDDWFLGGVIFPIAVLALLGFGGWRLFQGRGSDLPDSARIMRNVLFAFLLLAGCAVLAAGSGWASAVGGDAVVAGLVIAAGAMLAIGAFVGRVRWLILPALAVALPLALVSAAGIHADSSVGEREYRPATAAELHDHYKLGMGSLVVDLRDTDLPPGDHRIELELGIGEALLLVPEGVCVASDASIGLGSVDVFDRDSDGADVEWDDSREAPSDTPRVVVSADVGIGAFEVEHERPGHGHGPGFFGDSGPDRNGCVGDRA
jgi:Cell wall-active antibiotics response 4TMS YvqF